MSFLIFFYNISIENYPKVWTLEIFINVTSVCHLCSTYDHSKGLVVIQNGYCLKFGTTTELCRREYLTNNCFRRSMLTFLTYYSVGIHPSSIKGLGEVFRMPTNQPTNQEIKQPINPSLNNKF